MNDYVKVRITSDNKVKITAEYLDPVNFSVKMDESFYGIVNDGVNDGGLTLFISQ